CQVYDSSANVLV
nr:immunoglobulin light chain junction region [Macaca mulatta]MPO07417.1 immunoglobulin light chain junction region [Macaca mulatta]